MDTQIDQLFTLIEQTLKLNWVFEEETDEKEQMIDETATLVSSPQIIPPPRAELEILLDLAKSGRIRHIQERATYLTELDEKFIPFAHKLQQLAGSFQERAILTLIQQYLEVKNPKAEVWQTSALVKNAKTARLGSFLLRRRLDSNQR